MKVYGTTTPISGDMLSALRCLGYSGSRPRVRIICKAKSLDEANAKCFNAGLGRKVFVRDWTSTTGNDEELAITEATDIAIQCGHTGSFIMIEELREAMGKGE